MTTPKHCEGCNKDIAAGRNRFCRECAELRHRQMHNRYRLPCAGSYVVVNDPDEHGFRAGAEFDYLDIQSMLAQKVLSVGAVLENDQKKLRVVIGNRGAYRLEACQ